MNLIDFFIGLTLVNAMPHFVLGIWKGRMFSGLGFGNKNNLGYSLINIGISLGLFLYSYGIEGLAENGIYAGGLLTMLLYYLLGRFFYKRFHETHYQNKENPVLKS
ncbi:MAG: hypothetical protein MRZ79_05260 [Bacteroidia bacterium]|nr:hypothetical protein [Bacteroidia bacterium]